MFRVSGPTDRSYPATCIRPGPGIIVWHVGPELSPDRTEEFSSQHAPTTLLCISRPHEHRRCSSTTARSHILIWIIHKPELDALASLLCNVFWNGRLSPFGTCFVQVAVPLNVEVLLVLVLVLLFSPSDRHSHTRYDAENIHCTQPCPW